jgi:hypothetical protein
MIWFNIEKQFELEMFRHLKRKSHCFGKPYNVCETPMQQKCSTITQNKREGGSEKLD